MVHKVVYGPFECIFVALKSSYEHVNANAEGEAMKKRIARCKTEPVFRGSFLFAAD